VTKSSYQVIARRWRPKQFAELVGQDHVVRTLGNAIEMERIAHAYLFVGPRGTGKTTSARLFAKSLNWENGPSLEVPDDSEIGQAIMQGRCLDVIEIDGASNNSVDQVRDLRDECQYAPAQCRFKIYVIDEVHMLSQAAFNALLKTLEEPPPHVKFVFATTEANKVLPTIVSRCQRFEFRSIPVDLIVGKLNEICDKEKITVEPEALDAIARMAQGGMRDAQSILDQLISFCGTQISQSNVLDVYGLVARSRIEKLGDFILSGEYDSILKEADSFAQEGVDFYRALLDLADYIREFLVDSMKKSKGSYPEQAVRVLDALKAGESLVRSGLSEKTNFEVTLLRAVEAGKSRSIDQVIRQISGLVPSAIKKKSKQSQASPVNPAETPIDKMEQASAESLSRSTYDTPSSPVNESTSNPREGLSRKPMESERNLPEPVESKNVELKEEYATVAEESPPKEPVAKRRVQDQKLIDQRTERLPNGVRHVLKNKFRADFVSIEKIDQDLLI
jgi:DNA polymerase-3 subunit gamma/tau